MHKVDSEGCLIRRIPCKEMPSSIKNKLSYQNLH